MTDVQVSNARRIGFTALALVTFWVVAWRGYWIACDHAYGIARVTVTGLSIYIPPRSVFEVCLPAMIPMAFLSLSTANSLFRLRDSWTVVSTLMFIGVMGFADWLARVDVSTRIDSFREFRPTLTGTEPSTSIIALFTSLGRQLDSWDTELRGGHVASWLWLLLPLIATTAFVIVGAWRRAVRDAEVEPEDEDEDSAE